uniref:nucleotidyltransferase family protein n=1 Tax=uncultured Erythrobacter sp. TaxID=263913 RepID=UPI0026061106|nr:nucleotidyltransferase family protein [uncultured Erythrobacter sp.]
MDSTSPPTYADLPADLQLLAACCDTPVSSEGKAKLERLVAGVSNWRLINQSAARQQVQGFIHDRIGAMEAVPSGIRQNWLNEVRRAAQLNLRQAQATVNLHQKLGASGVPNLILKGIPLSAQLYQSLTIKRSGDIDILVAPEHAWKAARLLGESGYFPIETRRPLSEKQTASIVRHFKEITLINDANIIVDLHWRMIENRGILAGIDAFANAGRVEIGNLGHTSVLGDGDAFAYLCAHGALSDWSRLKWLADVNALLEGRSDSEIEALYAHARSMGAGPCALQALGLRELFWEKPLPSSCRQELETIDEPDFLGYPLERMLQPYRPASSRETVRRITRQTKVRSALYGSNFNAFTEKSSHLRALPDILALPLPAWLDWLYVPLRPIFWLMRKVRS